MTRITTSPGLSGSSSVGSGSRLLSSLLAVVASVVGVAMGLLVFRHVAGLGTGAPLVNDLLALDAGPHPTTPSLRAAAADSGSQLLHFAGLVCSIGAAVMLLLGVGLVVAGHRHRRVSRRLTTIGLWLALLVSLAAMLPVGGHPFVLGLAEDSVGGPATAQWPAVSRALAIAAGAGLLLASIEAGPRRRAESAARLAG